MSLFRTMKIGFTERVVEYVDGAFTRVLEPGRYRTRRHAEYRSVLVVDRIETIAPQEVLTSDGVSVRITAAVRWGVADPQRFVEAALDPSAVVYLAVQIALREALLDVDSDAIVRQARRALGTTITDVAQAAGEEVGIAVREVVVKDVILPHELRSAYAELVTTKARGAAQLEAARAETAALRSLANGAKLLDEHPALARMRLVQSLPPGSVVEVVAPE